MPSFGRQFSTDSPVLAMAPQPAHQAPLGAPAFTQSTESTQPTFGVAPAQGFASSGRKRSRDEAAANLEPDTPIAQPQEPEEEWVYGPGMTLIKSTKAYVADAASQSGTWVEEKKAADEEERRKQETNHPAPRHAKSQRVAQLDAMDGTSTMETLSTAHDIAKASYNDNGPVVDKFTLHLGIGWRKISDDEHIQAAARGWARYIENHYPVTNAQIRLESKGLQSYLVEATEGFFLFAEDLRQGKLVSTNADVALQNLQSSPPIFDGVETLVATDSPSPVSPGAAQHSAQDAEMHVD